MEPGCRLPQNFSGDWINTANIDADVFINETHIIETYYPDEGRYRRTIYVCRYVCYLCVNRLINNYRKLKYLNVNLSWWNFALTYLHIHFKNQTKV